MLSINVKIFRFLNSIPLIPAYFIVYKPTNHRLVSKIICLCRSMRTGNQKVYVKNQDIRSTDFLQ